jgi:hypothetical protein
MKKTWIAALPLVLAVLFVAACNGSASSVSGAVTYEGNPVNGRITFHPADGTGQEVGAEIVNGHYTVDGLLPGPKLVEVMAVKAVPFARSTEEMARRAAENKAKGDASGLIDPADTIPRDAEGNNVTHEIKPGKQMLNLDLKKPAISKS